MPINSQLNPTINDESISGAGSTSFGSVKFTPRFISGITGTYTATGSYQIVSRIVFFKVILQGSIVVGVSPIMYDPISPSRFPPGHALAGVVQARGMGNIEYSSVAPAVLFQRRLGGWDVNVAGTYSWIKLTGWYWVE